MPRYVSMQKWWTDNGPPVYMAVAGYLGLIKKPEPKKGTMADLAAMFRKATGGNKQ